ncbi:MAG: DHH family phosphoesterase [Thermodesulfobacteriota bacterium]|nr:DHH family phosphoesterase [Thermodesulfobacteriota bacterium]
MKAANKLLRFIHTKGSSLSPLLILTHDHPDPDSLASAFALQYLLKSECHVRSKIAYSGIIGRAENKAMVETLQLPVSELKGSDFSEYPHIALVDTQPSFENNSRPKDRDVSLVVDHHQSQIKRRTYSEIIDAQCGATSVIIAQAFLKLGKEIPKAIATALAYGIISETRNFGRESGRLEIKTYLSVLPKADLNALAHIQNPKLPREFYTILNKTIRDAFFFKGLIGVHLGFIKSQDAVSQMADFLLTYEKAEWSICTGRYQGRLFVSLRTNQPEAQAGRVLRNVLRERAGGHGTMAGGSIGFGTESCEKNLKKIEHTITVSLIKQLKINSPVRFQFPFRV